MADPLTIVGALGSVAGIIDVLGKSISTIRELQNDWKRADVYVLNIGAQLIALKTALAKIQEWMDNDSVGSHHQLVMDRDIVITCCKTLVENVDANLSRLKRDQDGKLDMSAKIKLVFGSNMDELPKMIERQTVALTAILSAYRL